ncbi:hypothetical protein K435DRAFT_968007 [Dendrothele bispora CBS 962.96]|uniref:Uncharacterized protein n=1 Tax=Dendrothele bispora (strain CBS 962.96) TaxID=1314807 RepID=A0A4S8LQP0_DENBC|nr:hypothetical protein K435DRAFT_968007 [Dendrothele bispora CBS 962.96]
MAPPKGTVLAHQRLSCVHIVLNLLSFFFVLPLVSPCVSAQRTPTSGISIINAPGPGNPGHVGSNISISIEVSGDGKLAPTEATDVNSQSPIHYTSLEIYLVSATANVNYTVSSGSQLLSQEPGSSVKHFDWPIPDCITSGDYNLTFYEGSMVNGSPFFVVTPVQIPIDNPNNPGATCDSSVVQMNTLLEQPQPSSPPPQPLFNANGDNGSANTRMTTSFTPILSLPTLVTITLSASGGIPFPVLPTATVTVTPAPTPTTVVVVSMSTYTTTFTQQGQTSIETVTEPVWTSTAVVQNNDDSGFIPVNAAGRTQKRILPVVLSAPVIFGLWLFV